MKSNPIRFRRLVLSATGFAAAGLISCTLSDTPKPKETPPGPQDPPRPVTLGGGEMQFVRLSRSDEVNPDYARVQVDDEGIVYLFWQEEPSPGNYKPGDYRNHDYRLRRRFADGSWDVEERIENTELNFDPVLLWDDQNRLCYTFYKDDDSGELWLSCMQPGGWTESTYSGYADLITSDLSLFLDPPRIVTAFTTHESSTGKLYFGRKPLAEGSGDINDVELVRDTDGTYVLAFVEENSTGSKARLMIMESEDRGKTWSDPEEAFEGYAESPKFFLAKDGTLYLAWTDYKSLSFLYRPPGGDWTEFSVTPETRHGSLFGDVFIGESADGMLWFAIWTHDAFYSLRGTVKDGFTDPVLLFEKNTDYMIVDVRAAFGRDGSLYATGRVYDDTKDFVIFGWI